MDHDAPRRRTTRLPRFRFARVTDAASVDAFLGRLSPATIQARYLSPRRLEGMVRDLEVARILRCDDRRHVVLLALEGREIRGIGELVLHDVDRAEVALLVEDAVQGRG